MTTVPFRGVLAEQLEWGTDRHGPVEGESSEEQAREVARASGCGLYKRPPLGRWKLEDTK